MPVPVVILGIFEERQQHAELTCQNILCLGEIAVGVFGLLQNRESDVCAGEQTHPTAFMPHFFAVRGRAVVSHKPGEQITVIDKFGKSISVTVGIAVGGKFVSLFLNILYPVDRTAGKFRLVKIEHCKLLEHYIEFETHVAEETVRVTSVAPDGNARAVH